MNPQSKFLEESYYTSISPTEFEQLVKDFLVVTGQPLPKFEVFHNVKETSYDGTFQIDIKATFEALGGSEIKVLVECKHYKSAIKREKVEILHSRLQSLGYNKGILFASSDFQNGAIEYAKAHGIALVFVLKGRFKYEVRSRDQLFARNLPGHIDAPQFIGVYGHNYRGARFNVSNLTVEDKEPLIDFIFNS
jgi:restriction system protein